MDMLAKLKKGLIVSCQARPGSPLRLPEVMAAMAKAAEVGGAAGIRANGPADISAIRAVTGLPIIGILKKEYPDSEVYITPTLEDARIVAAAGADILAMDCTDRPRPDGLSVAQAIRLYQRELRLPVMADTSTLQEGLQAAEAGADLVATTLSGYTPYSRQLATPDFELVAGLAERLSLPVIAEGRIASPEAARRALETGAYAVVVGTAITAVDWVTQQYARALKGL